MARSHFAYLRYITLSLILRRFALVQIIGDGVIQCSPFCVQLFQAFLVLLLDISKLYGRSGGNAERKRIVN